MAFRRAEFSIGEWYHCYTRTIEKSQAYASSSDYQRFVQALYLCNDNKPMHRDNISYLSHEDILQVPRTKPLVSIGAYCLMPTHFHLLICETEAGGISRFMQKVGTAYTMYFNVKYERVGGLFIRPFRAKHIVDDRYFKRVAQYIHLNPVELFEPGWKDGSVRDMPRLIESLRSYRFSSYPDYTGASRIERGILDVEHVGSLYENLPSIAGTVSESQAYYRDLKW